MYLELIRTKDPWIKCFKILPDSDSETIVFDQVPDNKLLNLVEKYYENDVGERIYGATQIIERLDQNRFTASIQVKKGDAEYKFETGQFRFSNNELQLLRSRFPFKKIGFQKIDKIIITRGSSVRRPFLLFLYGAIIVLGLLPFSYFFLENGWLLMHGYVESWELVDFVEALGYSFVAYALVFAIGVFAIYHAVFPALIMKVEHSEGQYVVLSLMRLKKRGKIFGLIKFLRSNFNSDSIQIDVNDQLKIGVNKL
jgi:hypothetical protein